MLFVISGEGNLILNKEIIPYATEGIVFLEPDQQVIFQEDSVTEILMIVFDTHLTEDFARKKASTPDFADTYKQAENLFKDLHIRQGKPIGNERDAQTIQYLVNQISFELTQQPTSFAKLIKSSIDSIVTILARNNFESRKVEEKNTQQVLTDAMIAYLKRELEASKTVRIGELLLRFNISEEAANLCMLNSTGMSLRNFIFKYKTDLFKSRMLKMDVSKLSA